MKSYIIELKTNVWLAKWGITSIIEVAHKFKNKAEVRDNLKKYSGQFPGAKIYPVGIDLCRDAETEIINPKKSKKCNIERDREIYELSQSWSRSRLCVKYNLSVSRISNIINHGSRIV